MNSIVKRLRKLADDELLAIGEAVDIELARRLDREEDAPDSARKRAVQRSQSYRHETGAAGVPIRVAGMPKPGKHRRVA